MPKKRTIQQKSEAESKGVLATLLKDWIVNPLNNDFGFDFEVRLTSSINEKTAEVSEISFYIQNKSSIYSKNEKAIEDISVEDWTLYLGQRIPVLIVKYDIPQKEFYWEIAQDYLWDTIEKEDQNWKRKKTKRITLQKKIKNLDDIKKSIISSQKRITRYHSLNLGIGEGIKVDEKDLSELIKTKEKSLAEYKFLSLKESVFAKKNGDFEGSHKLLLDVYNSPKNDEAKVRAIIGIIYDLNIIDPEQNKKIVLLANEAMKLCEELKLQDLKDYITILCSQAILYNIIDRMTKVHLGLMIQESQNYTGFSFFYNQELIKLYEAHQKVTLAINNSLINLLTNNIQYFVAALTNLLDIFAIQTANFAVFNKETIEQEKKLRTKFIEQCETALRLTSVIDLKKMLLRSLANYYYWLKEDKKAIDYLSQAIFLAKEDQDKAFVEANTSLLQKIKSKPDPYYIPKSKDVNDMTVEEYQEETKKLIRLQGISTQGNDSLTEAISIALRDINPKEYFMHCENLFIAYVNTSPVGRSIGLPSMGEKFVWCKYCTSSIAGFDLKGTFDLFKEKNCQSCTFKKPRDVNWICYVRWVREQQSSEEFSKVLSNFKKSFFQSK